jgi:two-component system sensor histidine kinase AlgZ
LRGFRYDAIRRTGLVRSPESVLRSAQHPEGWEQLPPSKRWKRLLAINLGAVIIAALLIIALYRPRQPFQIFLAFFYPVVCANIMGAFISTTLVRFGRRMYFQPFPLNWALIAGAILAGTLAGSLAANLIFLALGVPPASGFWASFWLVNQFAVVIALIFGVTGFLYEVFRTTLAAATIELRTAQLEEERARKYALEAQLRSLESHIRPHFLFNALNTISSLIQDDPKLAESLLGKLAALLRFSLDSNQQRVSALSREMKIVRDYLEIERARFGDRLRYEIAVSPEMVSAEVPAFSLQTLVENSVKHAVANRIEGGTIRIAARAGNGEMCLEVCDDGPGFTADAIRPGHGLDNLQSRLAALFGSEARLEITSEGGQTVVRLRFPV